MFKKLVLIFVVLIAVVAGLLAIFVATFDANDYKQEITNLVKKQTGRDLGISGELKLAVYPDIALEMGKTTLSNAAGFAGQEFATIDSARVSVKLLPLLKKNIQADAVLLDGLKLELHRKADGSTNWDDLINSSAKGDADKTSSDQPSNESKVNKTASKVVEDMLQNLSIAGVSLKNANIHWLDDQANQDISVVPLNLTTGKFSPGKPLPIDFAVLVKQKAPAMSIAAEGDTTVTLSNNNKNFDLSNLKLNTTITGAQIPNGAFEANLTGNIKGSPEKITVNALSLQSSLTGDLIPEGEVKTDISGDVNFDVNAQQLTIAGMKLNNNITGKPLAGGTLQALVIGDINLNLASQQLTIPNLALDAKLAGGHVKGGAANAKVNGNMQFDLAKQLLVITGMKAVADASGEALQGGTANANINGDVNLNLTSQKLTIPNLSLDAKANGGYVKGGAADAKVNGNLQFDLAKQLLFINGMKTTANANGELLQGGKANTNIAGDIQLDLANSNIKSPQLSLNSNIEGGLVPGGKLTQTAKGNLDLNWANSNGSVNLADLLVNVAGLEVKGSNVQVQPLAEKPAISGQFQTNTFNLKTLLKTLGIDAPTTSNPSALSQVHAQFGLDASTDKAALKGLNLKLDKSQLNGNFEINNFLSDNSMPSVRTQLSINSINLDDYLAPASDKPSAVAASNASASNTELLPLETLRNLTIDGDFKIGNMVINKLKMSNINAKVDAKQGLININPANAQLYSGKYVGRITIDARQATPTMNMRHELAGIRSEGLLFDLFQDKYISGGAKMLTELSSSGNTIDALLKNLNGTTSIGFNDGTIRDSSFAEKVSLAVKAFEKKEIKDGKSVVSFTGLSGDWKTTNGVFATDNLSMLSPYFSINGSGSADVAKQTLDMKLRIGPKTQDPKRPLFAPLRITGTFSDPKFSLDLEDLIKALAAQDLKELELKAKARIEQEKQALKLKVEKEKKALELKVANEKKALQQKINNEKAKQLQKVEKAKADAIQKLKDKTGDKLGNQILNQLQGKKPVPADGAQPTDAEPPKSVEDQVKDKLKDRLKGLF